VSRATTLVAGVGNVLLGDDGFGVEVARVLAASSLPEGVRVADFGIRGLHLAYELLDGGYQTTILVDATARGERAGTVTLLEIGAAAAAAAADAHGLTPDQVLGWVRAMGGDPGRVLVVGCEPQDTGEGMGLSAPVARAVPEAVALVRGLVGAEEPRR
jgi:hydrogenase maturation protease